MRLSMILAWTPMLLVIIEVPLDLFRLDTSVSPRNHANAAILQAPIVFVYGPVTPKTCADIRVTLVLNLSLFIKEERLPVTVQDVVGVRIKDRSHLFLTFRTVGQEIPSDYVRRICG
jgi:hypothetical protein